MHDQEEQPPGEWSAALFHFIGFGAAISFVLIVLMLAPGAFRGDFQVVGAFLDEYRGIEPFVIFILPVILIGGPAWMWRQWMMLRSRSRRNAGD